MYFPRIKIIKANRIEPYNNLFIINRFIYYHYIYLLFISHYYIYYIYFISTELPIVFPLRFQNYSIFLGLFEGKRLNEYWRRGSAGRGDCVFTFDIAFNTYEIVW